MLTEEYPVKMVCQVFNVSRSSYYYQPVESPDEVTLKRAIKKEAIGGPFCDHRHDGLLKICLVWWVGSSVVAAPGTMEQFAQHRDRVVLS